MRNLVRVLLLLGLPLVGHAAENPATRHARQPATRASTTREMVATMSIEGIKLEARGPIEVRVGEPGRFSVSLVSEGGVGSLLMDFGQGDDPGGWGLSVAARGPNASRSHHEFRFVGTHLMPGG